jgi:hypothetical protein
VIRRLIAAVLITAAPWALAERLDDSASPKRRLDLEPRWLHNEGYLGTPERLNAMVAAVPRVEVRLNTAKHVGKRGRIYLVMPPFVPGLNSPNGMRLEWRAHGLFQSGSALPGEKALLYDGPVTQSMMSDVLDFQVHLDARYVTSALRFDPVFDIEVSP